jgi:hypothetical protein
MTSGHLRKSFAGSVGEMGSGGSTPRGLGTSDHYPEKPTKFIDRLDDDVNFDADLSDEPVAPKAISAKALIHPLSEDLCLNEDLKPMQSIADGLRGDLDLSEDSNPMQFGTDSLRRDLDLSEDDTLM